MPDTLHPGQISFFVHFVATQGQGLPEVLGWIGPGLKPPTLGSPARRQDNYSDHLNFVLQGVKEQKKFII